MNTTAIKDCRGKEILYVRRVTGDFEISIQGPNGTFVFWFEMKAPQKQTYQKILEHFEDIKKLCKGQDET